MYINAFKSKCACAYPYQYIQALNNNIKTFSTLEMFSKKGPYKSN